MRPPYLRYLAERPPPVVAPHRREMLTIQDIIERAGGPEKIAGAIGAKHWAVRKWPKNGIPEKHWAALRGLTDIPIEQLHAANELIRIAAAD